MLVYQIAPDQMTSETVVGPEFSAAMELSGSITFTASDGSTVTVTGIADATEPIFGLLSMRLRSQHSQTTCEC